MPAKGSDNPFEIEEAEVDPAFLDGLLELILAELVDDWADLSASPHRVAEKVAHRLAPIMLGKYDEDEIRGHPWATR